MKTKFTLQEVTIALTRRNQIQEAYKVACAKMESIIGDKKHANGLLFEEMRISAPYRTAKAECEKWFSLERNFNKVAGKYLLGAMRYVSNPERYQSDKKYIG